MDPAVGCGMRWPGVHIRLARVIWLVAVCAHTHLQQLHGMEDVHACMYVLHTGLRSLFTGAGEMTERNGMMYDYAFEHCYYVPSPEPSRVWGLQHEPL